MFYFIWLVPIIIRYISTTCLDRYQQTSTMTATWPTDHTTRLPPSHPSPRRCRNSSLLRAGSTESESVCCLIMYPQTSRCNEAQSKECTYQVNRSLQTGGIYRHNSRMGANQWAMQPPLWAPPLKDTRTSRWRTSIRGSSTDRTAQDTSGAMRKLIMMVSCLLKS